MSETTIDVPAGYRMLRTGTREFFVREVRAESGRRWHVVVPTRSMTFYLWADLRLPAEATEEQVWRGVQRGVQRELSSPRTRMAPDYESALFREDFD